MDQQDDSAAPFQLADRPKLTSKMFQQHWGSFQFAETFDVSLSRTLTKEGFEQEMLQKSVVTMASGGGGGQLKFFLYAQHVSFLFFLFFLSFFPSAPELSSFLCFGSRFPPTCGFCSRPNCPSRRKAAR